MMNGIMDGRVNIWAEDIEDSAMEQIINIGNHPAIDHVAITADCHTGYGCPIGTVAATRGCIIPNIVGVDIGCSMAAYKTNIKVDDVLDKLVEIVNNIKYNIPFGFKHRNKVLDNIILPNIDKNTMPVCFEEVNNGALNQIGTSGGGNHFVEIQKDQNDNVWLMVHTGSRNLGKKVCDFYNNIANEKCTDYKQDNIVKQNLAFLAGNDMVNYVNEMLYCMDFAKENHRQIGIILKHIVKDVGNANVVEEYYTRHNYATLENHFGHNYWIHRKGAVRTRIGDMVIIPGSQGTESVICEGLGNKLSMCSASHGSGRKMSRKAAKENLNLDEVRADMDKKGIIHNIETIDQLDEAAAAYKDLNRVLELQADLIKPVVRLKPLAVVKG